MEKKNIKISFDKEEDMLSIFVSGKKAKFSLDVELPNGDIVVDYDFRGEVVGLEFFNASAYFPALKKVKKDAGLKGKLNSQYGRNWVQISYELSGAGIKRVSNSLISPYNKELIVGH